MLSGPLRHDNWACLGICEMHTLSDKHSIQKWKNLTFLSTLLCLYTECIQCAIILHTERDIRQSERSSPILKANRPNLRCDSGKSHDTMFYVSWHATRYCADKKVSRWRRRKRQSQRDSHLNPYVPFPAGCCWWWGGGGGLGIIIIVHHDYCIQEKI